MYEEFDYTIGGY